MKTLLPRKRWFRARCLPMAVAVGCLIGALRADVVIVETRTGGQNLSVYTEGTGNWQNSSVKSGAAGTTTGIGSRFCTLDGGTFSVSPTLTNAGGEYIVDVTHAASVNIPTDLLVSVTVNGGSGLPAATSAFDQVPANEWRTVGTVTLDPGVTTPTFTFTKLGGSTGTGQRFYADAIRFTYAGDPCRQTPQIDTVNGPLADGQTYVDVPTVMSDATAVVVYADGVEIGRLTAGIDGGVERVPTSPLIKGQIITATQVGLNGIESCRISTGGLVGGGANPRIRVSLSIRQSTTLTGPIGANGGTTNTPVFFLGATNVFGGGFGLAPVGGKVFQPDACWQTVTFQRGPNPADPIDRTYAWSGSLGDNTLQGDFGVLDAIAFAIDDLTDTGPFRIYIDELRNGDVRVQGWENSTNAESEVLFRRPGNSGIITTPYLLAQPPGAYSPNLAEVTDESAAGGNHSLRVSWQFIDRAGGNWVRLLATGSGTPNPQLDLRQPISFRMLLMPAGVPPLQICEQPEDTAGLQSQPVTLAVLAAGAPPLAYQWFSEGTLLPGETNRTLVIPNAQPSDSGVYHVVVSDVTGSLTSRDATLIVEPLAFSGAMDPLWSLTSSDRPYLAPDGQQSGLAFNSWSGNLILVTRTGGDAVIILNGETGADVGSFILDPFIVSGGLYVVNKVATTPDGAVYVCNLTTNAALDPFKIHRWLDDTPGAYPSDTIWQGNPSRADGGRWGDTMTARLVDVGGTAYPEFAVAAQNDNKIAVLRIWATDILFTVAEVPAGAFNDGLAWGEGDTVWGKSYQGHLYHIGLDFNSGTAAVLHVYPNLPSLAPIGLDPSHQLLGAVSIALPDALRLFSLANLASGPIALDTESFPSDQSSSPAVGAVTFGADRVYALNPNHGILAMSLRPFLQYSRAAQLLTLSWAGSATLQSAPNVSGPYQDIAGSISPVTVDMSTNGPQYFRLRN